MDIRSFRKQVVRREYKSRWLTSKIIWDLSYFLLCRKKHAPPLGKKSQHCGRLQHSFSFLDGTCSRRNSAGTDTLFGSFFWRTLETKKTTPSSSSFQTKSWESTFRKVVFEKKFFFRVRETTENPSISQLPCYHKSYKTRSFFTYLHCYTTLRNGLAFISGRRLETQSQPLLPGRMVKYCQSPRSCRSDIHHFPLRYWWSISTGTTYPNKLQS